jgi:DNA-binding NarL/FixJ family response regulator
MLIVLNLIGPTPRVTLSPRQQQIVQLLCGAKPNKEIASELHITEGTVKEYVSRIFRKTGAVNRTQLAVWAVKELGL